MNSARLASNIVEAKRHLQDCTLCPHACGVLRPAGHGLCGVDDVNYIASEMLHMGEEMFLRPAHAIFLSGCTARCSFCVANKFAFDAKYGISVRPEQLAERIVLRQEQGSRSICFIGGEPVPHIPFILETVEALGDRKRTPLVLNSNFYMTTAAQALLDNVVDIYLPDLKFGPGECGDIVGGMPNYWSVVTEQIDSVYQEGHDVVVRHLLMPGHLDCCTKPVLRWMAERPGLRVSLLDQYIAPTDARNELAGAVTDVESSAAYALASQLGLQLVT